MCFSSTHSYSFCSTMVWYKGRKIVSVAIGVRYVFSTKLEHAWPILPLSSYVWLDHTVPTDTLKLFTVVEKSHTHIHFIKLGLETGIAPQMIARRKPKLAPTGKRNNPATYIPFVLTTHAHESC